LHVPLRVEAAWTVVQLSVMPALPNAQLKLPAQAGVPEIERVLDVDATATRLPHSRSCRITQFFSMIRSDPVLGQNERESRGLVEPVGQCVTYVMRKA
jgi:hypothetical protein